MPRTARAFSRAARRQLKMLPVWSRSKAHEIERRARLDGVVALAEGVLHAQRRHASTARPCSTVSSGSAAAATGDGAHRACARGSRRARGSATSSRGDRRCGSASQLSSTQVSLVPPPCEEFTTSEPSRSATRVRPPGTTVTSLPESTKGRRSMCRGARPRSTKVGQVESASVGCAM